MTSHDKPNVIRVVTAHDASVEKVASIARKFAEHFNIIGYSVMHEVDKSLIGGFIIYASGYRYDYSTKSQLERLREHMKNAHHFSVDDERAETLKDQKTAIRGSLDQSLSELSDTPDNIFGKKQVWKTGKGASCIRDVFEEQALDQLIHESFKDFTEVVNVDEIGTVERIGDNVAIIKGINHCVANELILFPDSVYGIAMNLEESSVGVILLGDETKIKEGTVCMRSGRTINVTVGQRLLGRVIDPLGHPIDGKGVIRSTACRPIENIAPGIIDRASVHEPLYTGITSIDALTPIGKGQRELIIGDRQTGKTSIAVDTIINQRDKNVICVYVAIGQKMSNLVQVVQTLEQHHALDHCVIVAANASDQASLQYIAPFSGCAIAEHFMYENNKDVLIVYDDLTRHAQAYRAISLLLRRPPGREAYPGDVFYLHSRLLERAAKLSSQKGGGSMTALPIVETLSGDISAYIPTNIISITDGQIYLEPELFFSGQRPAINVGLSVSRVGGSAQVAAMRKVAGPLRIQLAQAREMAAFAQFGSDLDAHTQKQIKHGIVLSEVLKQRQFAPKPMSEQVLTLYLAGGEYMDFLHKNDVSEYVMSFVQKIRVLYPEILAEIEDNQILTDELRRKIDELAHDHAQAFINDRPDYGEME